MSSIPTSLGGHIGGLGLPPQVGGSDGLPSSPGTSRAAKPGAGEMAGRQIRVGDGQARTDTVSHADRAKSFFKTAGKVLGGIVLAPLALPVAVAAGAGLALTRAVLQIPKLINQHLLEPRADKRFEAANQTTLDKLRAPMQGSVTRDAGVMDRLEAHAQNMGTPLTRQQIADFVAAGERIAQQLVTGRGTPDADGMFDITHTLDGETAPAQDPKGSPLTLHVDGETVTVESSLYTTRALGWYMMASAARQDESRAQAGETGGRSDMATSGSFVMKDPGNAVYRFLSAAPTADSRMSTHFGERVAHDEKHMLAGLFQVDKPAQRGIEDYRNMLPGQGGTMLFDKLAGKDGSSELFVKFESVGCPPYTLTESHQGKGQAAMRFFAALDRNINHATNFVDSVLERFKSGHDEGQVKRQEHVYKGVLKESVAQPFAALVNHAVQTGVIDASAKDVARSVHKFGMPFVEEALDRIQDQATLRGNHGVLQELMGLRERIAGAMADLGAQSDRHGIERRGAEVHISLDPAHNR